MIGTYRRDLTFSVPIGTHTPLRSIPLVHRPIDTGRTAVEYNPVPANNVTTTNFDAGTYTPHDVIFHRGPNKGNYRPSIAHPSKLKQGFGFRFSRSLF